MTVVDKSYRYQAFISYAHSDREWAERLWRGLRHGGVDAFLDDETQRAGPPWEGQLMDGLVHQSRHLVVIWSEAARNSDWVQRELGKFDAFVSGSGPSNRHIIFVVLEGEPKAFLSYQMVLLVKEAQAYSGGAAAVGDSLWRRVVGKVVDSIREDDPSLSVPVLLLTTTRARMAQLSLQKPTELPFSHVLGALHQGTKKAFVDQRYGGTGREWRPFGGALTIEEILEQVRDDINAAIRQVGGRPIRWEHLDNFWSTDPAVFQAEARKLAAGPAIVVVDPLSFYDEFVLRRYANDLDPAFDNPEVVVVILSPFPGAAQTDMVRRVVSTMAGRIYRYFYEPLGNIGRHYPRCGPNVADETDLRGWLINAVAARVTARPEMTPTYTDVGGAPS